MKRGLSAQATQSAVAATPSAFDTQPVETEYSYDQVQEPSADNKSAFRLTGYQSATLYRTRTVQGFCSVRYGTVFSDFGFRN